MRILATILFILILSGCITQSKVNTWLNDHPTAAAGYCADKFPPDTTSRVVTDSIDTQAYEAAYNGMASYADSLFMQLKKARESFKATPQRPCPPAMNLDSLRKAVDAEIRRRLIPCRDTVKVVTNTVVDRAREKQLQGIIDQKDSTITARDKRITEMEGLRKWVWMFWGLVTLLGLYAFVKIRYKLPV
jgi:hypothetical protein